MEEKIPSASEQLMKVMEDFGQSEPAKLVVIWTNEAKDVVIQSYHPVTEVLGLLEYAKHYLIAHRIYDPHR